MSGSPLVTLIVRSMGRPCLADALASAARQTHRPLELLVIDATGGAHPPLPPLPQIATLRLIGCGRQLNRPAAANLGLDHACGEWVGFVDDDDLLEPSHVARLLARATEADRPRVVYAQHWSIDRLHRVAQRRHHAFNPLILHHYCRIPGMACLVHREVYSAQRFDEALETCEDWDYWLRAMSRTAFATVHEPTHFYFSESGTSGTSVGRNARSDDRPLQDRARVLERHAAARDEAWAEYLASLRGAVEPSFAFYERMLERYPDEPNAYALLGRAYASRGQLHTARRFLLHSIFFNGDAGQTHFALGEVCEVLGYGDEAREAYARAARYDAGSRKPAATPGIEPSRNAACPCGSGRRFKACHGREAPRARAPLAPSCRQTLDSAEAAAGRGDTTTALRVYTDAMTQEPQCVEAHHAAALLAWDLCDVDTALRRIATAAGLAPGNAQIEDDHARIRLDAHELRIARELRARIASEACATVAGDETASVPAGTPVHVVGPLADVAGHREVEALDLARALEAHAPVHVWSTAHAIAPALAAAGVRPLAGTLPQPASGVMVFCGAQPVPEWLARFDVQRTVIVHGFEDTPLLYDLVTALRRYGGQRARLVMPSEALRKQSGLPGFVCRPRVDLRRFHPRGAPRGGAFTVGCATRNEAGAFHPDSAMLLRRLASEGIKVRLLGGTVLMRHFPLAEGRCGVELLSPDAIDRAEFLRSLDCLLYRPAGRDDARHAIAVAQALASGLPMVCARQSSLAELVTHGVEGFLFDEDDADEALRYVRILRHAPALRARMSCAAREKAESVLGAARDARLRDAVLGPVLRFAALPALSISGA